MKITDLYQTDNQLTPEPVEVQEGESIGNYKRAKEWTRTQITRTRLKSNRKKLITRWHGIKDYFRQCLESEKKMIDN